MFDDNNIKVPLELNGSFSSNIDEIQGESDLFRFCGDFTYPSNDEQFCLTNTKDKDKEKEKGELDLNKKPNGYIVIELTVTKKSELNPTTIKYILPVHYSFEKIKNEIFVKLNLPEEIKNAFIQYESVKKIEEETSDENFKLIKRPRAKKGTIIKEEGDKKKQLGRKKKNDNEAHQHNKHSKDNIIQKIKTYFHDCLLRFIKAFLESYLSEDEIKKCIEKTKDPKYKSSNQTKENEIIKLLDHKIFANKTSKAENIKFLNMTLSQFFSQNISSKYKTFLKESNKIVIEEILNNHYNEAIDFVFNLKLSDWLDVFLKKKEFSDFEGFKSSIPVTMNVEVEGLLQKVYAEEEGKEKDYFSRFVLYIYNYERILQIIDNTLKIYEETK